MSTVAVTEARASLPALLARVEAGEEVTLTRHGKPVAVLVRPTLCSPAGRLALADAERAHRLIEEAPSRADTVGLDVAWAEEMVAEIRADRNSR